MKHLGLIALFALAGCASALVDEKPDEAVTAPVALEAEVKAPPPPPSARTEEAFDTTTAEEREAAVAAPEPAGEAKLGVTVATLGAPTDPGFWLETPLVSSMREGRVEAVNGKSVAVTLRPIEGPKTAGSRISLPALRLLEVGLAGLHEVAVYAQ